MSQIILLTHQKGGVGKSTIAYNLAKTFKNSNASVAIIDFDAQGSLLQVAGISNLDIFPHSGKIEDIKDLPYDYIFLDTPPYLMDKLESLCGLADMIIVPTKAGIFDLFAIEKTIEIIRKSGNEEKALIVFNMIKASTTLTEDIRKQLDKFEVRVAKTMLSDFVAFSRSSLIDLEENSKAKEQINELSYEVLKSLIEKK
jgi:chromosome partitioning protein